jgi:Ca-activated chloride channel family protein
MSDSQPTADDYRDRLVDRVLAEALGDERPPDLSQAILTKVEDEKVSIVQADQVVVKKPQRLRSRLIEFAVAASILGMLSTLLLSSVQHARLARGPLAMEESAPEAVAIAKPDTSEMRYQSKSVLLDGSGEALPPAQQDSAAGPTVHVGNSATAVTEESKEGWRIETLDGPESNYRRQQPSLRKETATGTQFAFQGQRPSYPMASSGSDATPEVSAAPATQQPSSGAYGSPSASKDDLRWFEPVDPDKDGQRRDFAWHGSIDKLYWSHSNPKTAIGLGGLINDATVPPNGPFGFSGGGEWPSQRYRHEPPTSRDRYEPIHENAFVKPVGEDALSTFSIDVDTASYANVRQYLRDMRQMPPADAVRIEELVNYFDYSYEAPKSDSEEPFAANLGCFACPWKPEHKLVRIGVKGREIAVDKRPLSNLVFLIDVSGSMNEWNKLPLVISGLKALLNKLGENDRVAIVVYAGSEGLVLPSTSGEQKDVIRAALDRLTAGGSTAGGAGLRLAYEIAEKSKIVGGVNRVVLCTDGDFNVGMTGTEEIAQFVETRAKETNVYLTVLGFGRGNLNDAMLEQISGRGDGNYAYIDDFKEAHRVLSSDMSKTLVAIAKDVKMQVEFNPAKVASYRLIGYENRVMAAEDFNNDAKDAGDIGAGHTVTALYEVVPVGVEEPAPAVDGLKYQTVDAVEDEAKRVELTASRQGAAVGDDAAHVEPTAFADELLTLKIRYKQPDGGASKKLELPLEDSDSDKSVAEAGADFRWAAAVAEFGMLLRNSRHVGDGSFDAVLELARGAIGDDPQGYRAEFIDLVRRAKEVSGR